MIYTALQLITRAYFLSGVVARNGQTVTADQITDGLYLLNALLDVKGSDLRLIPYFKPYEFDSVINQEMYFIPDLLLVDTMTFNIGVVRFPMKETTRYDYFATPRVDNIANLPFSYRLERVLGGMNIYVYFLPGGIYRFKLQGKFGLTDVSVNTDMAATYDLYYIEYLRYAIADYICAEYGATLPEQTRAKFNEIRAKLVDVSPADLSIRKQTYFGGAGGLDWQAVNIGLGWYPG